MRIFKFGGKSICESKAVISVNQIYNGTYPNNKTVTLTENLSACDKRRKLTKVELSQDEIKECVDKLGLKLMPQWLVTVCEVAGKVKVKFKGLVG